ncbi:MAG TPA: hypothetical protein V6C65_36265, partial [Allocoleopsis sp.]
MPIVYQCVYFVKTTGLIPPQVLRLWQAQRFSLLRSATLSYSGERKNLLLVCLVALSQQLEAT